jgi:Tol biopolymer transport system component
MTLGTGTRLGPYEITAKLGEGGMGEVYRATDTQLDRQVAIKVLPAEFTEDKERLARFEREAKLLAQLHHPNIASIFGLEESGGTRALVMELVEGPTLAERLEKGALPFNESLSVSLQIAQALEEAHEKGIIHRDLKPQNIKASIEGRVKVLDFGLAKAMDPGGVPGMTPADFANSPTVTFGGTREGVILGTAAYMAPEQARGGAVDKRADVWAFGVVLYEMLTGERLFAEGSVVDTLSAVMRKEIDLGRLPASAPPRLCELVARCLERDPKRRLRDIGEARWLLESGAVSGAVPHAPPLVEVPHAPRSGPWRRAAPWAVGLVGLALGATSWLVRPAPPSAPEARPVSRFALALPPGQPFNPGGAPALGLAISHDGRRLAYRTLNPRALSLRRFERLGIEILVDLEDASQPFFSPDGEWVAFFGGDALQKVSLRGGRPIPLARGFANAGWMLGTWCDDGTIVFDTWNAGLRAVGSDGGAVRTLTEATDAWHLDPQALPGPCRVLFFTQTGTHQTIELLSLADGSRRIVLDHASHGRYLASGHLLFVRDGAVQVAPFDLDRMELRGEAVPLPFDVVVDAVNASAPTPQLGVSRSGTLVYAPADPGSRKASLVRIARRDGSTTRLGPLEMERPAIRLAPDGQRLALAGRRGGAARIEALDLVRGATTPLVDLAADLPAAPVWSPDGLSFYFSRYGPREGEILRRTLATGEERSLVRMPGTWFCPWSISPDGRFLIFSAYDPQNGADLWLLDFERAPAADAVRPLVATAGSEWGAEISPDGRWFAYTTQTPDGDDQVLVERFPSGGERTLIANAWDVPFWAPDGRELYYVVRTVEGLTLMAVPVALAPTFRAGPARPVVSGRFLTSNDMGRSYTVTPDGASFLFIEREGSASASGYSDSANELVVVENWFTELRRQASSPADR